MTRVNQRTVTLGILIGIASITAAFGFFYSGFSLGTNQPRNILVSGATNIESVKNPDADFSVFWEAWQKLKDTHIKGAEAQNK